MSDATTLTKLLTAQELSKTTGISVQRIYELTRRRMIPTVRLGRSYRYSPRAVAEWMAAGGTGEEDGPRAA